MSEWQPISTAPRDAPLVLFHPRIFSPMVLGAVMRIGFPDDWPNRPPTHWMPLPEPPRDG
jgi:hypothetical protein